MRYLNETIAEVPLRDLNDAIGLLMEYKSMAEGSGQTGAAHKVEGLIARLKQYNNEAVQRTGGGQEYRL